VLNERFVPGQGPAFCGVQYIVKQPVKWIRAKFTIQVYCGCLAGGVEDGVLNNANTTTLTLDASIPNRLR
jgi:hypothetical protein